MLPSYEFFIRNVLDLKMSDVEISTSSPDSNAAFLFHDVQDADLFRLKAQQTPSVDSFTLRNVSGFNLQQSAQWADKKLDKIARQNF